MFSTSTGKALKRVRIITLFLSLIGIALSGYSIFVHYKKGTDKNYTAFCDIRDDISCSKIFTSKWGKGFGFLSALLGEDSPLIVSNGVYGIIFYVLVIALGELSSLTAAHIQRIIVVATNLLSVYLGYVLLFILKDKCVVCISIYAINFLIAISCFIRVRCMDSKYKKKGNNKSAAKNGSQQQQQQQQQQNQKKGGKKGNNQNFTKNAQNSTKSTPNVQISTKTEQNSNKTTQVPNKNTQNENKKNSKKNAEIVINNKNAVNSKKNPAEQIKNVSKSKSQQNSNKNIPNANKNTTKPNANSNKHSKKKN